MTRSDWIAERWLLRFIRTCGFAVPGDETFEAAVRAGAATSLVAAAAAFDALRRLRLIELAGPVAVLTREGERAADAAARHAGTLGEPAVALPESRLPAIVMAEADYETVDSAAETGMLQPSREEARMKDVLSPAGQRFSLDDPEAGRKLVENLDRRKVRLAFSELCWHFRCESYDDKMRLRAFLLDLSIAGDVLEVLPNLYCRPALAGGSSDPDAVRTAASEIEKIRKSRPKKDAARRDAEAAAICAYLRGNGGVAARAKVVEEGARLGLGAQRVSYLIQHLRAVGTVTNAAHGVYRLRDGAPTPAGEDENVPEDGPADDPIADDA